MPQTCAVCGDNEINEKCVCGTAYCSRECKSLNITEHKCSKYFQRNRHVENGPFLDRNVHSSTYNTVESTFTFGDIILLMFLHEMVTEAMETATSEPIKVPEYEVPSSVPEEESTENCDEACILCCSNKKSTTIKPCGHQIMCISCSGKFKSSGQHKCPICRKDIQEIIKETLKQ